MTTVVRLLPRALARMPRLSFSPGLRRRLLALVTVLALLAAGYVLWLRDSSLVRVERVEVSGLAMTPAAPRLENELTAAAERMSTLNLDEAALERIVADHPVVRDIRLKPDFPHSLRIEVVENRPVALVAADSGRVPVAADGTLLGGVETNGSLPEVQTTAGVPASGRLRTGAALDRVVVAGAAPPALIAKIASITIQPGKGFVAQVADGPAIWLGDSTRLEEKWRAATAVLAQESSQGAAYIDVRAAERAVAGGLTVTHEPQAPASDALPDAPQEESGTAPPPDAATADPAVPAPAEPEQTQPSAPVPEPQP